MWSILKGEWRKIRRCQILLVGIVALALCPVVQYGSQLIVNPENRDRKSTRLNSSHIGSSRMPSSA